MIVSLTSTPPPQRSLAATARLLSHATLAALATPMVVSLAWALTSGSTLSWVAATLTTGYTVLSGTVVRVVMGQLSRDLAEDTTASTPQTGEHAVVIPFPLVRAAAG